jgi:RHS repeat-associated protein
VNGRTTAFLYDGRQAIAELQGGAIQAAYHTGLQLDEVIARYSHTGNKTLLTDALASVIGQFNDDQTAATYYAYSPYGESVVLGLDDGNPLQYTGRENDRTGLYFYRARYYDPLLKQFIQEDPLGVAGGANLYAYVVGNPISYTDPKGLKYVCDFVQHGVQHIPVKILIREEEGYWDTWCAPLPVPSGGLPDPEDTHPSRRGRSGGRGGFPGDFNWKRECREYWKVTRPAEYYEGIETWIWGFLKCYDTCDPTKITRHPYRFQAY